jgi:uncharacterized tellurite resistance protein B-like protein
MASPVAGIAPMPSQPMSNPSASQMSPNVHALVTTGEEAEMRLEPPPIDRNKIRSLGAKLSSDFNNYESYRRNAEMRWARNLRQFLGEYDPEVKNLIDSKRSLAYPRITRVKCMSMLARLMNLLFPTSEKNWGIAASPVPNLDTVELNQVLQEVQQQEQQVEVTGDMIEQAVMNFATGRAGALEKEIEDQLAEIGGARHLDYVALCRRVLMSGVLYGVGVLKGPFVRMQRQRTWQQMPGPMTFNPQTGQPQMQPPTWQAVESEAYRPQFEFVPLWDYYPDMSAKHWHQMDGQFHRMVVSKSQLREYADRPEFFGECVREILQNMPQGNYKEKTYETELRVIGVQSNVNPHTGNKFEIIIWDGFVNKDYIKAAGIELPQGLEDDLVEASVWMIGNEPIRCDLSPWVELEPTERVQMYHHFVFEEDDSSLLGNGLPNIIRDSQMSISASTRMLLDNASVVCGPNVEVNMDLLEPGQDFKSIQPYKVWLRNGTGQEAGYPAVKNVDINSHITELSGVVKMFMEFADAETFINPATGGDMQQGPSEPFRTAAGASMLHGLAALPFKDVVRNFDTFTMSVMNSLVLFNKHFNPKPPLKGDFQPVARGASSLIAKEVRGIAYDNLANSLQPEERPYVQWHQLLKERMAVRDMDINKVIVSDIQAKQIDANQSQKAQEQAADMKELMKAEVRKLLADAAKALTQSDKNTAASEVAVINTILAGLEKGVTPTDIHAARAGGGVPPHVADRIQRESSAITAKASADQSRANQSKAPDSRSK